MSGHNKWSKIKHKKAGSDAKKSQVFSKLARLLSVESKKAGGDVNAPGLRVIIEKAKAANMPRENIERAVKKGMAADAALLEAVTYEAYGPGGCALIIDALTENRNKASAEIKHVLNEHGSSLASPGSALWAFTKTTQGWSAQTPLSLCETDTEKLEELVGALEENDEVQKVYTNASL